LGEKKERNAPRPSSKGKKGRGGNVVSPSFWRRKNTFDYSGFYSLKNRERKPHSPTKEGKKTARRKKKSTSPEEKEKGKEKRTAALRRRT